MLKFKEDGERRRRAHEHLRQHLRRGVSCLSKQRQAGVAFPTFSSAVTLEAGHLRCRALVRVTFDASNRVLHSLEVLGCALS